MTVLRLDNIGIVVEDLDAAIAFFVALGLELEGRMPIEGEWAGRVTGVRDQRVEIAMLRTPDGHGRVELSRFDAPPIAGDHRRAPVNSLGYLRAMFAVDDLDATLARLSAHGTTVVDEVVDYEGIYRLCYVRGPEGLLVGLAQPRAIATPPAAHAEMRIRRTAAEVFEAFVDPAITAQFWFTAGSGRLAVGREVTWTWAMYGVSTRVRTTALDPGRRLVFEWDGYTGRTTVEWTFAAHDDGSTQVAVRETGWTGTGDELLGYVADSTQGFTLTLAGAKAFLEHGLRLNLVADKDPDAHVADGTR